MAISRWERGTQEPSAGGYIGLGNLAGAPLCWYFWGRAGLRAENLRRAMPKFGRQLSRTGTLNFQIASAGRDRKSTRLNSSHSQISYAVFCLKKKKLDNPQAAELAHEGAEQSLRGVDRSQA